MNCEAIYCYDLATVRFAIYPDDFDGPRILADISEDALRDLFGARGGADNLVEACRANFDRIAGQALKRYRNEPSKAVSLSIDDFTAVSVLDKVVVG